MSAHDWLGTAPFALTAIGCLIWSRADDDTGRRVGVACFWAGLVCGVTYAAGVLSGATT